MKGGKIRSRGFKCIKLGGKQNIHIQFKIFIYVTF